MAVGRSLILAGSMAMVEGRLVEAVAKFQAARSAFGRADDAGGQAGAELNIGLVQRHLGDHPGAIELLMRSAERFGELCDAYGEAVALVNMAASYRDLSDDLAARTSLERAHELVRDLDQPGFALFVRANLGATQGALGELDLAREQLLGVIEQARTLGAPEVLAEAIGHLAELELPESPQRARSLVLPELDTIRKSGNLLLVAKTLILLAESSPTLEEARAAWEESLEMLEEVNEPASAMRAHRAVAQTCEELGDVDSALEHWRKALEAAELLAEQERDRRLARVQLSAAVNEARAEAERSARRVAELTMASRMHLDLIGMIGHELRNPLSVAQLSANLLETTSDPERIRANASRIASAHDRMARMLDAITADAAAERGQLVLSFAVEDLDRLVAAIADNHRATARAKGQVVVVQAEPVRAEVDADRLFHALDNLVSNAVKYSPRGSTIVVRVGRESGKGQIEVLDEGPGISGDEAADVFGPFSRGNASPTGGERSTGLGLHIASRMVEAHSGTLGVRPRTDGPGACFWIQLPLRATPQEQAIPDA